MDNNDFDLFAGSVNPAPYPQHGTPDAQRAWWDKDRALKRGTAASHEAARGDGFDLPLLPPPIGPYPRTGTYDDRTDWVQRASVACANAGITEHNRAIAYEWLKLMEEYRQEQIEELTKQNDDLTMRLRKAELAHIDVMAERLHESARGFVIEEFGRQKASLEKRALAIVTKSGDYDAPALNVLNAKVVLLMQRCAELEQLSPLWVSIHTRGV